MDEVAPAGPVGVRYRHVFFVGYLWNKLGELGTRRVKPASSNWTVLWILKTLKKRLQWTRINDPSVNRIIDKWIKSLSSKYRMGQLLTENDSKRLKDEFSAVWDHFVNEVLNNTVVLAQPPQGLLNQESLRKGPRALLGENTYNALDNGTRRDLGDGVISMIVGLWTPAVMITLRSVEGSLRTYYENLLGKPPQDDEERFLSWGKMLDDMSGKIKPSLKGYLDFLRDRRNEADHPGKRFSQEMAERTLTHAIEALKVMQK